MKGVPKEELKYLYLGKKLCQAELALHFGVARPTIGEKLKLYKIPLRSRSEATKNAIEQGKFKIPNQAGSKNAHWKGGRIKSPEGYTRIYYPSHPSIPVSHYVFEHRLIMEKHLGRYLKSWEVVHHLNGIKNDNRIENLQLLPVGQENVIIEKMRREIERLEKENEKLKS